jgi:hypothetical protein
MSSTKPVYLVSPGMCRVMTEHKSGNTSNVIFMHAGVKGDEQKWIPEFGEEPDTVALKCVANDKYLNAIGKGHSHVGTGEKTWWKMLYDQVRIPGAFRLSVVGFPEKYNLQTANSISTEISTMMYEWNVCLSFYQPCMARILC